MTRPARTIARSEAFDAGPHVLIHRMPVRRRRGRVLGAPLWAWAVTGWAGFIVSVDVHLGMPLCLAVTLGAIAVAYFWRKAA